jgi:hypothetical protein
MIEEFLVDPIEPAPLSAGEISDFVYRYTGTGGFGYTRETEQFRLNAWSSMKDPRETKNWVAAGPIHGVSPLTDDEVLKRIDDVLRRSARPTTNLSSALLSCLAIMSLTSGVERGVRTEDELVQWCHRQARCR